MVQNSCVPDWKVSLPQGERYLPVYLGSIGRLLKRTCRVDTETRAPCSRSRRWRPTTVLSNEQACDPLSPSIRILITEGPSAPDRAISV